MMQPIDPGSLGDADLWGNSDDQILSDPEQQQRSASGPLRIGWFSSGGGEGSMGMLQQTVEAIESGELNAQIEFLFCNREPRQRAATDKFLAYASRNGIPIVTLSSYKFRRQRGELPRESLRVVYEEAVMEKLSSFSPTISVTAGYMLIAPLLCTKYKMVNLHPALPGGPIGTWQEVIWALIAQAAQESGVMVHTLTPEVDAGPVLAYSRYPIVGDELDWMWFRIRGRTIEEMKEREGETLPLFKAIRALGLVRERPMLVETLKAISGGQISPFNTAMDGPFDLTEQVEAAVKKI